MQRFIQKLNRYFEINWSTSISKIKNLRRLGFGDIRPLNKSLPTTQKLLLKGDNLGAKHPSKKS